MSKKLHIKKITLHNILGVKDLEIEAGKFNAVVGRNASGKTSVLEAIKAAVRGGHDATLLRKGETEGEIVLVLDDDRAIRRRVTADNTKTDLIVDGKATPKPMNVISALSDALSVNPVAFLRADEKDRADVLLKSMPLSIDYKRLADISGVDIAEPESGQNGLAIIDAVRKQVFDDRTVTNRVQKEKDGTINQLKSAMPAVPAAAAEGNEDELRAKLQKASEDHQAELHRIETKLNGLRTTKDQDIIDLRQTANAAIAAINAKLAADIATRNAAHEKIESLAAQQLVKVKGEFATAKTGLQASVDALVADRTNAVKRQQTEEMIRRLEQEFADLGESSARQTKALAEIDAYKFELLAKLPIPGLTVIDGKVMRDGVAFDRLNMAQQVDIAVQIAKLRSGKLGVVCVDGIELMDPKTFDAFRDQLLKSDLQLFVSRVSDEPFAIDID